jgi:hypothetical protein
MSFLFGSEDKVATGSSLDENQQAIANKLRELLMNGMTNKPAEYTGNLVAPTTDQQKAAMVGVQDLLGQSGALSKIMGGNTQTEAENYYKNTVENPTIKALKETVLPDINEQFAGQGNFWSSARMDSLGKAVSDTMGNLAANKAQVMYGDKQNTISNALNAAGQLIGGNQALYSMGANEQAVNQNGLALKYQDWLRTQSENNPYLASALQYLGTPMMYAVNQQGSPGLLGGLGSLAGGIGSMAAGFGWSDERLKTDIQQVGTLKNGIPLVEFRYKWDEPSTRRVGVLSKDVREVMPEAVATDPESGYDLVDYAALGLEVA